MKKLAVALALSVLLAACGRFHNADAGQPEVDTASTDNKVASIVRCITDEAKKHDTPVKQTAIPQGAMLEFGESNIVKVRYDNGETTIATIPASAIRRTCGSKAPARSVRPELARPES